MHDKNFIPLVPLIGIAYTCTRRWQLRGFYFYNMVTPDQILTLQEVVGPRLAEVEDYLSSQKERWHGVRSRHKKNRALRNIAFHMQQELFPDSGVTPQALFLVFIEDLRKAIE